MRDIFKTPEPVVSLTHRLFELWKFPKEPRAGGFNKIKELPNTGLFTPCLRSLGWNTVQQHGT